MSRFVLTKRGTGELPAQEGEVNRFPVGGDAFTVVEVPDQAAERVAEAVEGEVFESEVEAREAGVSRSGVAPGPGGQGVSHHFEGDFGGDVQEEFEMTPPEGPAGAGGQGFMPPRREWRSRTDGPEPDTTE